MNEMLKALYGMKESMEQVLIAWEGLSGRDEQISEDSYPFEEPFGNLQDQLEDWIKSLS